MMNSEKVKQSLYKPGRALWDPGVLSSQISTQSVYECGNGVIPTQRPPLPPEKYVFLLLISVGG
jgi:hypothetical protein